MRPELPGYDYTLQYPERDLANLLEAHGVTNLSQLARELGSTPCTVSGWSTGRIPMKACWKWAVRAYLLCSSDAERLMAVYLIRTHVSRVPSKRKSDKRWMLENTGQKLNLKIFGPFGTPPSSSSLYSNLLSHIAYNPTTKTADVLAGSSFDLLKHAEKVFQIIPANEFLEDNLGIASLSQC